MISIVRTARLRALEEIARKHEVLKAESDDLAASFDRLIEQHGELTESHLELQARHEKTAHRLARRSIEKSAAMALLDRYRKIADALCELREAEVEAAEDGGPSQHSDEPTNAGGMP